MNRILLKILVIAITTPLTLPVALLGVSAASYSLAPSSGTLEEACESSVSIEIDTQGGSSNSGEAIVSYDPNLITIIDSDPSTPGTQIKEGNAYKLYFYNQVNVGAGEIRIAGASIGSVLTERKTMATIEFESKPGVTSAGFNIQFLGVGATQDSNIADITTNLDLLTSVTNGRYQFTAGDCITDTEAPMTDFLSPFPGEIGVLPDSSISIRITDNLSGVDLTPLTFIINGITYVSTDPEVSYIGNDLNYTFTIIPREPINIETPNSITVTGSDIAGNQFSEQMVFNVGEISTASTGICPICILDDSDTTGEQISTTQFVKSITNYFTSDAGLSGTFLEGTILDDIAREVGPAGLTALAAGLTYSAGIAQFAYVGSVPNLFLAGIRGILGRGAKNPWGLVMDGTTGEPLNLSACSLYKKGTNGSLKKTVADMDGRYGFDVELGDYEIEIHKPGYKPYKSEVTVDKKGHIVRDIELFKKEIVNEHMITNPRKAATTRTKSFLTTASKVLFPVGFISAAVAAAYQPGAENAAILSYYGVVGAGSVARSVTGYIRSRATSEIIDSVKKLRIPHANIKIFDLKSGKLVDTKASNLGGFFDFQGESGTYGLMASAKGYSFPSKKLEGFDHVKKKFGEMIKIDLKKGKNNLKLLADPVKGKGSVRSPFVK